MGSRKKKTMSSTEQRLQQVIDASRDKTHAPIPQRSSQERTRKKKVTVLAVLTCVAVGLCCIWPVWPLAFVTFACVAVTLRGVSLGDIWPRQTSGPQGMDNVQVIINALRDNTPVPTTQLYFQKPVDVATQGSFMFIQGYGEKGKADGAKWIADEEDPQQPFLTIRRKAETQNPPTTAADPDSAALTATDGETLGFAGCTKCANGTGVQFVAVMRWVAPNYALPNECTLIALERNGNACILSLRESPTAAKDQLLAIKQLLVAIDSIAKLIPECPWDVVNKASYQPHKADLAPRFPQLQNRRCEVLRPVPQKLLPCTFQYARKGEPPVNSLDEATGRREALRQWLLTFSGVSGIGKTVSALRFLDVLCDNFISDGERVIDPDHRFGIYMRYDTDCNLPLHAKYLIQVDACAEALYALLKNCAHHFDVPVTEVAMFYFVIDEIGGARELVKKILAKDAKFATDVKEKLKSLLSGAGYSEAQLDNLFGTMRTPTGAGHRVFEVMFAVVGTGVGSLNDTGDNSLPDTYVHVSTNTGKMASDVFKQTMEQFRFSSQTAQDVLEELQKDMLCKYLLTNARCAAYMAEVVRSVLDLYGFAEGISPASVIASFSLTIARAVAKKYLQSNGWLKISDLNERDRLRCALLSLAHTQEHGYYVVSSSDLRSLCVSVGAVEDYLVFRDKGDAELLRDIHKAANSDMGQRYQEKLDAKPVYIPPDSNRSHTWMERGANGKPLRFGLNPGVLVAVLLEEVGLKDPALELQTPGGMAGVYERLVAAYMSMQINALHYYCMDTLPSTGDCEREWKVPLVLVDRTAPASVELTLRGVEPWNRAVLPPIQSNNETLRNLEGRAAKIAEAVKTTGTVVELAGDGAARNDVTIYSKGVIHGMECKHYRNQTNRVLSFDVLVKRAGHMGFTEVRIAECGEIVRQPQEGSGPATYKVEGEKNTSLFGTSNAAKMKKSFERVEDAINDKPRTAVFQTKPYWSPEGHANRWHYTNIESELRTQPDAPCEQSLTIVSPFPVPVPKVQFCGYQGTNLQWETEEKGLSISCSGTSNKNISIGSWVWSLQTLSECCTREKQAIGATPAPPAHANQQTTEESLIAREGLQTVSSKSILQPSSPKWQHDFFDDQYCKLSWEIVDGKLRASLPVHRPLILTERVPDNTAADVPTSVSQRKSR